MCQAVSSSQVSESFYSEGYLFETPSPSLPASDDQKESLLERPLYEGAKPIQSIVSIRSCRYLGSR